MKTGEKIRELRKSKKMSMKELGTLIGVSEQAISQYERGTRNISLEKLIKISEVFRVTVNELSEEKYPTPSQEFLNDFLKKHNETLESLSEKADIPLNELKALYNNTLGGYTVGTYKKLYNYAGLSDVEAFCYLAYDAKINSIYSNNGSNEEFNIIRDSFIGSININEDLSFEVDYKKDMQNNITEYLNLYKNDLPIGIDPNNNQVENIKDSNINNTLSDKSYICDSRKISNIYEIEDIYKEKINHMKSLYETEINNQKKYIEDINAVKDELNRILKEKNLIIDKLEKIINNLEENNNSQPK